MKNPLPFEYEETWWSAGALLVQAPGGTRVRYSWEEIEQVDVRVRQAKKARGAFVGINRRHRRLSVHGRSG